MKKRAILLAVPIAALGLWSCEKKAEPTSETPPAAEASADAPAEPATESKAAPTALSAEQRAAKLGFAQHLPPDTEAFTYVFNGARTVSAVSNSKIWRLLSSEMGMGGGGFEAEEFDQEMD